ncbi:hypothetical protein [Nonomuraea sp. NPDC003214]
MRRPQFGRDGHGTRIQTGPGEAGPALPARVVSKPAVDDDPGSGPGQWVLAVDPALLPLPAGAELVEDGGAARSWTVVEAQDLPSAFDPGISYVRVEAALNAASG